LGPRYFCTSCQSLAFAISQMSSPNQLQASSGREHVIRAVIKNTFYQLEVCRERQVELQRCQSEPVLSLQAAAASKEPSDDVPFMVGYWQHLQEGTRNRKAANSGRGGGDCVGLPEKRATKPETPFPLLWAPGRDRPLTTLKVSGIPEANTQQDLLDEFSKHGLVGIDFVYMPRNLRRDCEHFGYAFVDFQDPAQAAQAAAHMKGLTSDGDFDIEALVSAWSRDQGLALNLQRYRNSPLMHEIVPNMFKPSVYDGQGNKLTFPRPTVTIRAPRANFPVMRELRASEARRSVSF